MSTLERWLPFKFRRQGAAQKEKSTEATTAPMPSLSPFSSFWGQPLSSWMHGLGNDPFAHLSEIDSWFGDFTPARFRPLVDVVDEENTLCVTAELPGMDKDDIDISIDNDVLTIRGEKKNEGESEENGVFRTERYYGFVQRSLPLPSNIDQAKANAGFENGVLTVRFPKTGAKERSTQISIKS